MNQFLPSTLPLSSRHRDGMSDARNTANAAQTLTRIMGMYQPMMMCTPDGRLFRVMACLADTYPAHDVPARSSMPRVMSPGLPKTPHSAANELSALTAGSWHVIGSENGFDVEVLGEPAGFSQAIPFRIHWLADSRRWACVGGQFTQRAREATDTTPAVPERVITVDSVILTLDSGLIGMWLELDENRWSVQSAKWDTRSPTAASSSAMPDSVFVPLFAVTTEPVSVWDLGWQQPADATRYKPFLIPVGITGNNLSQS